MSTPPRLGDILIRGKKIAPHQLGVALSVQRKSRLPLGQILLQTQIITRAQLWLALAQQKLGNIFGGGKKGVALYGHELVTWGRSLLERHVKTSGAPEAATADTERMRRELANLPPTRAGRIVEDDEALKERLLTGNF